jgi:epoxyqueuosine reductase
VSLVDWLETDDRELRERYARLYVPGNDGRFLKRNALVALGNTGGPEHRPLAERFRGADDPLLGEHADWAVARIDERVAGV